MIKPRKKRIKSCLEIISFKPLTVWVIQSMRLNEQDLLNNKEALIIIRSTALNKIERMHNNWGHQMSFIVASAFNLDRNSSLSYIPIVFQFQS
jgi:hypothetical protein